ncbi:MAG: flagellar biosynthetic protein FliR [Oleiphilaceae bacterium]|nr:flagellar biosynthetic protein FliR [Oleiphilaceae bacterium]
MVLTDAQIAAWLGSFLWPLFRIASFFMVIPIIGTQLVPMRVRMGLALVVTMAVAPLLGDMPQVDALSLNALFITLQQVFIGTILGFMFVMLMQLFVVAGQMIAMQMGLGFASMVDPSNGVNVPVLSQIFLIAVTLMFLAMNGHLVMIEVVVESFRSWPVSETILGAGGFGMDLLWEVIMRINWLFASALLLALPAITSVLIVNLSFGIMTRAAPQMNVFSLGFPIGMIFGLFIIWVSTGELLPQFQKLSEETYLFLRELQRA